MQVSWFEKNSSKNNFKILVTLDHSKGNFCSWMRYFVSRIIEKDQFFMYNKSLKFTNKQTLKVDKLMNIKSLKLGEIVNAP